MTAVSLGRHREIVSFLEEAAAGVAVAAVCVDDGTVKEDAVDRIGAQLPQPVEHPVAPRTVQAEGRFDGVDVLLDRAVFASLLPLGVPPGVFGLDRVDVEVNDGAYAGGPRVLEPAFQIVELRRRVPGRVVPEEELPPVQVTPHRVNVCGRGVDLSHSTCHHLGVGPGGAVRLDVEDLGELDDRQRFCKPPVGFIFAFSHCSRSLDGGVRGSGASRRFSTITGGRRRCKGGVCRQASSEGGSAALSSSRPEILER